MPRHYCVLKWFPIKSISYLGNELPMKYTTSVQYGTISLPKKIIWQLILNKYLVIGIIAETWKSI